MCLPYHHCRLVKTVENAAAVELRCLRISAQSVNISLVWIKILTTAKNAEYVGKEHLACQCSYQIYLLFSSHTQRDIFFLSNINFSVHVFVVRGVLIRKST